MLRRHFPLRVAAVAALLQATVLLLVLGGAYVSTAIALGRTMDEALIRAAGDREGNLPGALPPAPETAAEVRNRGVVFDNLVTVKGRDRDGRDHGHANDESEHLSRSQRSEWMERIWPAPDSIRVAYVATPDGRIVTAAAPAGALAREIAGVLKVLSAVAAAAVPISAFLVFWVSRRAFMPLSQMAASLSAVGPTSLSARVAVPAGDGDGTVERLTTVLNRMLDRLQAGFQAQSRFVDAASHELRTPLAALRTQLEVSLRQPRTAIEYQQSLGSALEEVERLTRLSDDLLLLARHERGVTLPMAAGVGVADVAHRVVRELASLAEERQVALVIDIPPALALDCDEVAIERAIANVVRNAIQHSPPRGAVTLTAKPAMSSARPGIAITIADHGAGIPGDDLARIFEPYYRSDGTGASGGTGLGLSIVRALIQAHSGDVSAANSPEGGTVFSIWLPLQQNLGLAAANVQRK